MLRLRMNTEDWREKVTGWVGQDEDVDALADELCGDVLTRLAADGVEYERAHQQSVGAFAIVQGGTPAERAAFDAALDAAVRLMKTTV